MVGETCAVHGTVEQRAVSYAPSTLCPIDPVRAMVVSSPLWQNIVSTLGYYNNKEEAFVPVYRKRPMGGSPCVFQRMCCGPTSSSLRRTSRSNTGKSHGGPSSRDATFVVSPNSTELERLIGPGRGITVVMHAARSTPLTIAFLKLRNLRWGSWGMVATKNMGHSRRRRSVDLGTEALQQQRRDPIGVV